MSDALPARAGRYQIGAGLGVGGFAQVVRGYDESLETDVALKILDSRFAFDPELRERFIAEARLLRRVRNGHVLSVFDIGELEDGRPFFVMELARGGTLGQRILQRSAAADELSMARVVDALSDGLDSLHSAGVIHRDIKPGNLLIITEDRRDAAPSEATVISTAILEASERLVVGDLGLAKDQSRTELGPTILGGSPFFRSPEQGRLGAPITPATDVYAATAVLWNLILRQPPPEPEAVDLVLSGAPKAWRNFFRTGLAVEPESRYQSMRRWREAAEEALGSEQPPGRGGGSKPHTSLTSAETDHLCPYKGLSAFQAEDSALFFGRRALTEELVTRLTRSTVLVVGGPSGSGKSSLVRAGLLPALEHGALPGSQYWDLKILTPGATPLAALADALNLTARGVRADGTRAAGAESDTGTGITVGGLAENPQSVQSVLSSGRSVVVVVDQLEEIFTLCDSPTRVAFLAALAALSSAPTSAGKVVLSVRADFYGRCAEHPWLAASITDNQVLVGSMSRSDLREAVTGPAQRVGLRIEPSLVDTIITEAGEQPGALPLLADALVETWLRRDGDRLTLNAYQAAGGLTGSIAQRAERVYSAQNSEEQGATRRLLLQLVTTADGQSTTRRRVNPTEAAPHDIDRSVLAKLIDARLVIVADETAEIAHEALIDAWPRLTDWVAGARQDLRTRDRLLRAAADWESAEADADLLLRGAPLTAALEWADRFEEHADQRLVRYLERSEATRDASLVASERQQQRSRRVRRRVLIGVSLLAAASTLASGVALTALSDSRSSLAEARTARRAAEDRFAAALAATSQGLASSDPRQALALALEAVERSDSSPAALRALVTARQSLSDQSASGVVAYGSPFDSGDALVGLLTPDGSRAAMAGREGVFTLWDTVRLEKLATLIGPTGGIQTLATDATGQFLISGDDAGEVWRWDLAAPDASKPNATKPGSSKSADPTILQGRKLATLGRIWGVDVAPSGDELAVASADGTVRLLDAETGRQLGERVMSLPGDFKSVAYNPTGTMLVAGTGSGALYRFTLPDRQPFGEVLQPHTSDLWQLEVLQGSVVTRSADGSSKQLKLLDGTTLGTVFAPRRRPNSAGTVASNAASTSAPVAEPNTTPTAAPMVGADSMAVLDEGSVLLGLSSLELGLVQASERAPDSVRQEGAAIAEWSAEPHLQPALQTDKIRSLSASADGHTVLSISEDKTAQIWRRSEPGTGLTRERFRIDAPATGLAAVGTYIVVGTTDNVWVKSNPADSNPAGSNPTQTDPGPNAVVLPGHSGEVRALAGIGSKRLLTGDGVGTVRIWDLGSGDLISERSLRDSAPLVAAAVTPDEKTALLVDSEGDVHILDLATLEDRSTRRVPAIPGATDIAADPSGAGFTVAGNEFIYRFNIDGTPIGARTKVAEDSVWSVAYSPDGQTIITGDAEENVRTWELNNDRLNSRHEMTSHRDGAIDLGLVNSLAVVATDRFGALHVWDLDSGESLGPAQPLHPRGLTFLAVQGSSLLTAGVDGVILETDVIDPQVGCRLVGSSFTASDQERLFQTKQASCQGGLGR